jgi:putative cofactor-binding repeat protein
MLSARERFDPFTRGLINLAGCFSDARALVSASLLFPPAGERFARIYLSPRYHISRSRHVTCRTLRRNSLTLAGKRVFVSFYIRVRCVGFSRASSVVRASFAVISGNVIDNF